MAHVRNIGIMAHIDAGKTTVSERLLYVSGRAHKIGEVHEGGATMDWMVQERERGITITSAATTFNWEVEPKPEAPLPETAELHLIDTPGHVDFTIEVSRSLRVLDGAVTVFDGVHGVEPQTETVWRQADRYGVPRIGFINKMDRTGADFWRSLKTMEERFGEHCAPAAIPIGTENQHKGIVELVERRAWTWSDPNDPRSYTLGEVPSDLVDEVEDARNLFLERVAIADDEFALTWLEDPESISIADIHAAIRRAVIAGKLVPVLCGSALRNKGIQPLLNAIVTWLPSPEDVPEIEGVHPKTLEPETRPHDPKAPLSGLAFKVSMMGDDGRRLVFVRLYSGTLTAGVDILNATRGIKEKPSRIFLIHASQKERRDSIGAGNIFAVLGLKHTKTGDTICDPAKPILLEQIDAYEPVISQSVEPEQTRDRDKLIETLGKLADEDPTFRWREDQQTGQTIISGMGELHLDVLADRIRREFDVPVRIGRPQVVYRETITESAVADEIFERTPEGNAQQLFGQVAVRIKPRERGEGNLVEWAFPKEGTPAATIQWFTEELKKKIQDGIDTQLNAGVLAGDPVQDVHVVIAHVGHREGVNNIVGYPIAATMALRKAMSEAGPARLAPIANVEVSCPPEYTGDIISSINQRRGIIESMEDQTQVTKIKASVPVERMFGYSTELRSISKGYGTFQMTFSHYDIA